MHPHTAQKLGSVAIMLLKPILKCSKHRYGSTMAINYAVIINSINTMTILTVSKWWVTDHISGTKSMLTQMCIKIPLLIIWENPLLGLSSLSTFLPLSHIPSWYFPFGHDFSAAYECFGVLQSSFPFAMVGDQHLDWHMPLPVDPLAFTSSQWTFRSIPSIFDRPGWYWWD